MNQMYFQEYIQGNASGILVRVSLWFASHMMKNVICQHTEWRGLLLWPLLRVWMCYVVSNAFHAFPCRQLECDCALQHSFRVHQNLATLPRRVFSPERKYVWFTRLRSRDK